MSSDSQVRVRAVKKLLDFYGFSVPRSLYIVSTNSLGENLRNVKEYQDM